MFEDMFKMGGWKITQSDGSKIIIWQFNDMRVHTKKILKNGSKV